MAEWFRRLITTHLEAKRISSGTDVSQREYIGQFSDNSNLLYLQARYAEPSRGQFLSQDPVFWEIGLTRDGKNALSNPQALNSYAYANNNPITGKDPSGRQAAQAAQILFADTPLLLMPQTWPVTVPIAIIAGGVMVYEGTSALLRQSGGRYVPFSQQGREVQLPGVPDPLNPWDGWKPGDVKDWKTWAGTGLGIIGAATEIYQSARDLPSNKGQSSPTSGGWAPLSPMVIQGGTSYYRNYSGLLSTTPQNATGQQSSSGGGGGGGGSASYNAQIASFQAQINQIQAQINVIVQSRSSTSR